MSRTVIVTLIYHGQKPLDRIFIECEATSDCPMLLPVDFYTFHIPAVAINFRCENNIANAMAKKSFPCPHESSSTQKLRTLELRRVQPGRIIGMQTERNLYRGHSYYMCISEERGRKTVAVAIIRLSLEQLLSCEADCSLKGSLHHSGDRFGK
jgi:hypothetical protein